MKWCQRKILEDLGLVLWGKFVASRHRTASADSWAAGCWLAAGSGLGQPQIPRGPEDVGRELGSAQPRGPKIPAETIRSPATSIHGMNIGWTWASARRPVISCYLQLLRGSRREPNNKSIHFQLQTLVWSCISFVDNGLPYCIVQYIITCVADARRFCSRRFDPVHPTKLNGYYPRDRLPRSFSFESPMFNVRVSLLG